MAKVKFTTKQRERLEGRYIDLGHEITDDAAQARLSDGAIRNKAKVIRAACKLAALAMALDPETEAYVLDDMDKLRKELV